MTFLAAELCNFTRHGKPLLVWRSCSSYFCTNAHLTVVCVVGGAVGAVVAAPVVLGAAGFTSAGILAGSLGAKMMAAAAVANGGGVAAGGLVATLQTAGAAGLSGIATGVVAGTGAAAGWLTSFFT